MQHGNACGRAAPHAALLLAGALAACGAALRHAACCAALRHAALALLVALAACHDEDEH